VGTSGSHDHEAAKQRAGTRVHRPSHHRESVPVRTASRTSATSSRTQRSTSSPRPLIRSTTSPAGGVFSPCSFGVALARVLILCRGNAESMREIPRGLVSLIGNRTVALDGCHDAWLWQCGHQQLDVSVV
jgi:hypothetical protein